MDLPKSCAFPLQREVRLPARPGKSRHGCFACKKAHVRCDQTPPACLRCKKRGIECSGYMPPSLKWVTPNVRSTPQQNLARRSRNMLKSLEMQREAYNSMAQFIGSPLQLSSKVNKGAISADRETQQHKALFPLLPNAKASPYLPSRLWNHDTELRDYLIEHYFANVASIFTIYDTLENPFGEEIRYILQPEDSAISRHTIVSIAAVHLADCNNDDCMRAYGLEVRTKAITSLRNSLRMHNWHQDAFVSSILLCLTESYYRHDSCGIQYLESAKNLVSFDRVAYLHLSPAIRNSLCWLETLISLVADYEPITFDNRHMVDETGASLILEHIPHGVLDPLLGIWSSILPTIGRLGKVLRKAKRTNDYEQKELIRHLMPIETFLLEWECAEGDVAPRDEGSGDLIENVAVNDFDGRYCVSIDGIPDKTQFVAMAHAYRLSGLLEIYRSASRLLNQRISALATICTTEEFLQDLAGTVIALLRQISPGSRLFNVSSFPLMTAGQLCESEEARLWIRGVLEDLRARNGIAAVTKLIEALEIVWQRRDQGESISWTDVFDEWNCTMMIN